MIFRFFAADVLVLIRLRTTLSDGKGMRSSAVGGMAMHERIVNAWITLFFVRMKYFFAWKVSWQD